MNFTSRSIRSFTLSFGFFLSGTFLAQGEGPPPAALLEDSLGQAVVVLVNQNDPDSLPLAQYYAQARKVPADNIVMLDLPVEANISRADYENLLRVPLVEALDQRKLVELKPRLNIFRGERTLRYSTRSSRVRFLVSMPGVPLRVTDTTARISRALQNRVGLPDHRDSAAVDAELALMLAEPYSTTEPYPNPDYNAWQAPFPSMNGDFILHVTRLDGPSTNAVHRMIEHALHAERYGLLGRVYIDLDGHHRLTDPYVMGDLWFQRAGEVLNQLGYEVFVQKDEFEYEADYPMEQVGCYLGWYREQVTGPFAAPDFTFFPGAFAYHLHSISAADPKRRDAYWVGPLLERGAAASMGTVDEPYLHLTPQPDILMERLAVGYSLGEAAHFAERELSWQTTVFGDPLYRPFRYPLEVQVRNMETDHHPGLAWGYLRQINLLLLAGRYTLAVETCEARFQATQSPVLQEKLADLHAQNGSFEKALLLYHPIASGAEAPATAFRMAGKMVDVLRSAGKPEGIEGVLTMMQARFPEHRYLNWLQRFAGSHVPPGALEESKINPSAEKEVAP